MIEDSPGIPVKLIKTTLGVLGDVGAERRRQDRKWGAGQTHPFGMGTQYQQAMADYHKARCESAAREGRVTWEEILMEEVAEAFAESDPAKIREEMIQVAAVAVRIVEDIDERGLA